MNGSIYDLAAIYVIFLEGEKIDKKRSCELLKAIANILDNGYTYEDIRNEIMNSFHKNDMFPFYKFKRTKENGNILKQGVRYYHKQLNIMSQLKPVCHNIDAGTITSQGESEYWIEPRASYTIKDLIDYMYSKNIISVDEFPPKRLYGLMKAIVSQYGLEIVLFMIEHCARIYDSDHEMFSLKTFSSYHSIAVSYLEEIKNNCVYSGGVDYVPRKRVLFD